MQIVDRLTLDGELIAYCIGEDIPLSFQCKKIAVSGQEFSVLKSGSAKAFCGKMNALLTLDVRSLSEIPLGEITIIQ